MGNSADSYGRIDSQDTGMHVQQTTKFTKDDVSTVMRLVASSDPSTFMSSIAANSHIYIDAISTHSRNGISCNLNDRWTPQRCSCWRCRCPAISTSSTVSVYWFYHARFFNQTIGNIMQSNRECIQMQIHHLYAKCKCFILVNLHGMLIFCHFLFSSPRPHLQPLLPLPRVLCLLQCHHSLCFILPFSAPAPLFLAPRHSQTLNYAMPNQLFRVPKDPKAHFLPYDPSTLSYLTSLSSIVGFSHHWTQVCKSQFSKARHWSRQFSSQYCWWKFVSDADSS